MSENGSGATCPTCGQEFDTAHGMRVHHAQMHDERLGVVDVVCENCGCEFEKRQDMAKQTEHHFCSDKCDGEWRQDALAGQRSPRWSRVTVNCHWCGNNVEKERRKAQNHRNFCSDECESAWRSEYFSSEITTVERACSICGELIERPPSQFYGAGQVCSDACKKEYMSAQMSGENNHFWKGGSEGYYGPSWKKQRRKALERDGRQCVSCGCSEKDHQEEHGEGLHVHHVTPFRKFGLEQHETANRLNNLVTLCRSCHQRWEGVPVRPKLTNNGKDDTIQSHND